MKEVRFFYVPDAQHREELPQDEAVHALRVLRLQPGDEMFLMDGEGCFCKAAVTVASSKHCLYRIVETLPQERAWRGRIHLGIAPTKDIGRMEWMAEKATEVGFDEITFLNCKFSERRNIRTDRMERIVVSAMKQSRKGWKPQVNPLCSFSDFVAAPLGGRKFICHCYEEIERKDFFTEIGRSTGDDDITVLIGPEGDFSTDEVRLALKHGYESVTLGSSRLRTETAGLSAVMMSQLARRSERALLSCRASADGEPSA
ncbi:RsmE family RNA methyltransferase [Prevotella dentasini]|uniref:RsmE family RNA methyltransferase n=1 Tax=Prevotella dentasini TaxID=589537 RepID=UPI0004689517|nr:RsmE family RNA methyltransferase [Prevotella dentasini]